MNERNLSAEIKAATQSDVIAPLFLISADFPEGEVFAFSGIGEIVWNGKTWLGLGELMTLDLASEVMDGSAQGSSVTVTGIDSTLFSSVMLGNYPGRKAKVYFGILNLETHQIEGEPYLLFSGLLDSDEIEDTGEEVSLKINIEHRLSDLLRRRQYRYTDQDQQSLQPTKGDKGLQFVASMVDVKLKWGRA